MSEHSFTYTCECEACKGTGLYVGLAERTGAAVVCHDCSGTGARTVTLHWKDFTERKRRPNVIRVFEVNPGIVIGASVQSGLKDFGGMPYDDWLQGKPFPPQSEDREHTCPAWWYQTADYTRKPDWKKCWACNTFSKCSHFGTKDACWRQCDCEFGTGRV